MTDDETGEFQDIKSSGEKRQFNTGSVRDSRTGKGRYDLISPIALRALALRMEGGAEHYGERNWEKGQPLSSYLDSATRHIQNHAEGKRDEDHMGAALWNIHCFIHTEEMIRRGVLPKELNDLPSYISNHPDDGPTGVVSKEQATYELGEPRLCSHCGYNLFTCNAGEFAVCGRCRNTLR